LPSPDGEWLLFNSQRSGNWDVWRVRLTADAGTAGRGIDAATLHNLTDHPATDITRSWSADGTRGIWLMGPDGSDQRVLYDGPGAEAFAAWSPDGRRVAFEIETDGVKDIWVMEGDVSGLRPARNRRARR
jgi:Tol biopolymer transport system component